MTLASATYYRQLLGEGQSFLIYLKLYPVPQLLLVSQSHLVKALQQAHNSALDLLLVERTTGAVEPHSLEALDLGDGNGSDAGSSEGADGGRSGGDAERSENGGSEHICGSVYIERKRLRLRRWRAVESVEMMRFKKW
jgi:hypothetical protein